MKHLLFVTILLMELATSANAEEQFSFNSHPKSGGANICIGELCRIFNRLHVYDSLAGPAAVLSAKHIGKKIDTLNSSMVTVLEQQTSTIEALTKTLEDTYETRLKAIEENLLLRLSYLSEKQSLKEDEKQQLKADIIKELQASFHPGEQP